MNYQYPFRAPWRVSLPFGVRGTLWKAGYHSGLDLVSQAAGGDGVVHPVAPGRVIRAQTGHPSYGNYVTVRHEDGMLSLYAHPHRLRAAAGDVVDVGSVLGTEGASGNATGVHLHLELHRGEYAYPSSIDPAAFLEERLETQTAEQPDAYAEEAVAWAVEREILQGDGEGLKLREALTRQDAVVMLFRLWEGLEAAVPPADPPACAGEAAAPAAAAASEPAECAGETETAGERDIVPSETAEEVCTEAAPVLSEALSAVQGAVTVVPEHVSVMLRAVTVIPEAAAAVTEVESLPDTVTIVTEPAPQGGEAV